MRKKYYCIDCKKKLKDYRNYRCHSCENKRRHKLGILNSKGKDNPNFGNHKLVGWNNPMYGIHRFNQKNPNYIDGRTLKTYYCPFCGKKLSSYQANLCRSCSNKGEHNPNFNNWSSLEPYPLGWTKTFKEQIRFRDKYKCQLCGCPEIECKRNLEIHHKDYDKQNLNPNNLVSLCKSCHMKTNYNRDYWKQLLIKKESK